MIPANNFEHVANAHTRRAYCRWWARFQREAGALTAPALANWLARLAKAGLGKSSLTQARAAVISGAKALWLAGNLEQNNYLILKEVDLPNAESGQRAGRWLAQEEMQQMFQQVQAAKTEAKQKRDWLVVLLLGVMGLRRDEAASLSWDDVLVDGGELRLRIHGKGSKVGYILVPAMVADALEQWREFCPMQASTPILRRVWRTGKVDQAGLSGDGLYTIIRQLAVEAGLGKVAPHDLRRSVAGLLERNGVPVAEISRLLRHSTEAVTHRYLEQRGAGAAMIAAELLECPQQMALPLAV